MAAPDPTGLRILVGAGSFADAAEALRIVGQLPKRIRAQLGGILVEEPDTLATCQIPNQRIILLSGRTTLAPGLSQIRTVLNADAKAFRQSLALAAGPDHTEWMFRQDKGNLVESSLRAARGWDILVIGYGKVHKVIGKVIVLQTATRASTEMDETANNLARQFSTRRLVLSVHPGGSGAPSPSLPDTRRFDTLDQILHVLARTNALVVLVDLQNGPLRGPHDLARLHEAARCPLIVFGASGTPSLLEPGARSVPTLTDPKHPNGS